jgi:hypothetical protein
MPFWLNVVCFTLGSVGVVAFGFGKSQNFRYTCRMLWRVRNRGRPLNSPAAFIHPCQPIVAKQPPSAGAELKHDGYRLHMFCKQQDKANR